MYDNFGPPANEVDKEVITIEEKLKAIEGSNDLGLIDVEICLVPVVVIPAKLKVPDFEKYKGASDPEHILGLIAERWLPTLMMINCLCTYSKTL